MITRDGELAMLAQLEAVLARCRYRIVRCYFDRTIPRRQVRGLGNLSLADAQAHCRKAETSSSTCTGKVGRARTARRGPWFDAYEAVKGGSR